MPLQVDGTGLGLIGYAVIFAILILVIGRVTYVIPTLVLAPVIGAVLAGFGPAEIGEFATSGLQGIVEITAMFAFAVWYFAVMRDAGLFDPLIRRIISVILRRPALLTVGTVVLAMLTHLDGAGATTFLITIPALLPLYQALEVDTKVLAALAALGAGSMNLVPWGGVTVRAISAIEDAEVADIYTPLIPAQVAGIVAVLLIAGYFSRRVGRGDTTLEADHSRLLTQAVGEDPTEINTVWLLNLALTLVIIVVLVLDLTSPAIVFMLGLVFALLLNVGSYEEQKEVLEEYSADVMTYVGILLAAGILLGVINDSGMVDEMATILLSLIPDGLGPLIPVLIGVAAVPLSLLFSPDAFYFGALPVLAETAAEFGIAEATVAQAALLGQMTVGFPVSPLTGATFLLIGLADVELGEHIKFTFLWAWLVSLVMVVTAVVIGVLPL